MQTRMQMRCRFVDSSSVIVQSSHRRRLVPRHREMSSPWKAYWDRSLAVLKNNSARGTSCALSSAV